MVDETVEIPLALDKQVVVNGVDVSSYIMSLSITEPNTGVKTAEVLVSKDMVSDVTVLNGNVIEIWLGYSGEILSKKFYGYVVSTEEDVTGFRLICNDGLWKATGQLITKLYDIEDPSDLFGGDIRLICIDMCSQVGLIMSDSTIDQTSVTVPQILCDGVNGKQKLDEMGVLLGWDLYQNPNDTLVYMKNPTLYSLYNKTLTVGTNVTDTPTYSFNIMQVINEVELQGVIAYPTSTDTFSGDGTSTAFQLSKYPVGVYMNVTIDGVIKIGSVAGSSGVYDYLINTNGGTITFTNPPAAGTSIVVVFTAPEVTSVTVDDAESIAKYTKRKVIIVLKDIMTIADAEQRGNEIIAESKEAFNNFTISAYNVNDLSMRNSINFSDPIKQREFSNLRIQQITWQWPRTEVQINVGMSQFKLDSLLRTIEERVKALERVSKEGIQLTITKSFDNKLYFIMDDLEITQEDIATGNITTLIKRKNQWLGYDELSLGSWDPNINITNGKVELI